MLSVCRCCHDTQRTERAQREHRQRTDSDSDTPTQHAPTAHRESTNTATATAHRQRQRTDSAQREHQHRQHNRCIERSNSTILCKIEVKKWHKKQHQKNDSIESNMQITGAAHNTKSPIISASEFARCVMAHIITGRL